MSIDILLHAMEHTDEGFTLCDRDEADSWCVLVRRYLPNGDVEVVIDEDFDTYQLALARAQEMQRLYPQANYEEL